MGAAHIEEMTTEEGIDFRSEEIFRVYKRNLVPSLA